jgi:hypothetical protein
LRREVKREVRLAKAAHFGAIMAQCHDNPRKSWATINKHIGRAGSDLFLPSLVTPTGTISDQSQIGNALNAHFSSASVGIDQMFAPRQGPHQIGSARCAVDMPPFNVTASDVVKAVSSMKADFAGCLVAIPGAIFKRHKRILASPLAILLNKLTSAGMYPKELKTTTVKPIRKGGRGQWANALSDLRPIGSIPFLAKLWDSLLNVALTEHLLTNAVLSHSQFGFRRFCSTEIANQVLMERISRHIDEKNRALLISLDVSRAFDSIDHQILLTKLEHAGVRGQLLSFFQNYLSNRSLRTRYGGKLSVECEATLGVIQGSPLSATLFILYMNDLLLLDLQAILSAFADDCTLVVGARNVADLISTANSDLQMVADWFCRNRLILNGGKSSAVFFGLLNDPCNCLDGLIIVNQVPLIIKRSAKILGLIIDDQLNFAPHIDMIVSKLAAANAMILRLKLAAFPRASLLAAFRALVMPHLFYCASLWQAASKARIKKTQTQQNKGLRIIFGLSARTSTEPVRVAHNFLSVKQIIEYSVAKLIFCHSDFRNAHPLLSPMFGHHFGGTPTSRAQSNGDIYVWAFASERRRRTVFVSGIRAFNLLPQNIRRTTSLGAFKYQMKQLLNSTDPDLPIQ